MSAIQLPATRDAWGMPEFERVAKQEISSLGAADLPLQQALSRSSYATAAPIEATILRAEEGHGRLRVKAGIFYRGVIAGCSCADDPTPTDELQEYCVLTFDIDMTTGDATVALVDD